MFPVETERDPEFTSAQLEKIDKIIDSYKDQPGSLILVLEEIQDILGYLPASIQRYVSKKMEVPLSWVYGVVTFYSFFTMKPRGKHTIRVCLGTACHVRGAKRNVDHMKRSLNVEVGDCTKDRQFSLEVVRCLGACGLAPVMVVDEDTHRQVKETKLEKILDGYRE